MKYDEEIVQKICEIVAEDEYYISEICLQVGIGESTFYEWKAEKPEFVKALKEADNKRLEAFRTAARKGLRTLLEGKEYEETTVEYKQVKNGKDSKGNPTYTPIKMLEKKVKKFIMPNAAAVIFANTNLDADNFKNTMHSNNRNVDKNGEDVKPVFITNVFPGVDKNL